MCGRICARFFSSRKGLVHGIAASPFLRCQKPRAVSIAASPFLRLGSPRESSREGETARNLDRGCRGRPVRVPEERRHRGGTAASERHGVRMPFGALWAGGGHVGPITWWGRELARWPDLTLNTYLHAALGLFLQKGPN